MSAEETAPEGAPEAADTPAEAQATETTEAAPAAPEAPETPAEPHKPSAVDRRIAQLTARLANEAAQRQQAMRELEAVRAQNAKPDEPTQAPTRAQIEAEIERRAEQKAAANEQQKAAATWLKAGRTEFADFDEKSGVLASLGATERPAFLEAVVGLPNGHRLVPILADDPDEAMRILDLPPLRMAAELGRLAERAAAPAKPKAVSAAPAPGTPVTGRARRDWNVNDEDIPMEVYLKLRDKQDAERRRR